MTTSTLHVRAPPQQPSTTVKTFFTQSRKENSVSSIKSLQKQIAELEAKLQETRKQAQERLGRETLSRIEKRCRARDVELQIVDLWKLIRDPDVVADVLIDEIIDACGQVGADENTAADPSDKEQNLDAAAPTHREAESVNEEQINAQQ